MPSSPLLRYVDNADELLQFHLGGYVTFEHFIVLLFIRAPFYILLVFIGRCSLFLVVLVKFQYLSSDWLERLL